MKSIKKNLNKNRIKITVTVSPDEMEAHFEEELSKLAPTVTIPGFRTGKAPRVMIIESIGHSRLSQLALEKAINKSFQSALFEHKEIPVNQPSISVSKYPAFGGEKEQNELIFEVEFDVISGAKIGDYKKIKIKKDKQESLEVTDEEVAGVVKYLQRQKAELSDEKGGAKKGDWIEGSFEGSIKGVVQEKLTSSNMPIVIGETKLIPGFEEEIIGIKKGEARQFDIKFAKDFPEKTLANQTARFKFECLEVKKIILPKIDSDFISSFGLKTEKELRARIKESLIQEKKDRDLEGKKALIAEELIKITKVEIPSSMIEQEAQRMTELLKNDLKSRGMTLEKYQENLKIDDKKMRSDLSVQAKRNIVLGVALAEVAKAEKINISDKSGVDNLYLKLISILKI